jgi:hypothetical protein
MPKNIQELIKFMKTNGLYADYLLSNGKINMNKFAILFQEIHFDKIYFRRLFDLVDHIIFRRLNKTGSVERVVFNQMIPSRFMKVLQRHFSRSLCEIKLMWENYGAV